MIKSHKLRQASLNEGSARIIARLFFQPLLKELPDKYSIREKMDILFGSKYREITECVALRDFTIRGILITPDGETSSSSSKRTVKAGQKLFVRRDMRDKGRIDVEVMLNDEDSRVFILNPFQYITVEDCVMEMFF